MNITLPDREETYCQACGNSPDDHCIICGRRAKADQFMRYEVRVVADVLMEEGEPTFTRRQLAKHIYSVLLKHAEPICDVEVMDDGTVED